MFYDNLDVDLFSFSESLYRKLTNRLQIVTAAPTFYMIRDNPLSNLGIVDYSLNTLIFDLLDD